MFLALRHYGMRFDKRGDLKEIRAAAYGGLNTKNIGT
jgi:hypothetical protein